MINKINNTSGNNISFKRVFTTTSLANIDLPDLKRLDAAIELINKYYPQNDVFLGADETGELVYQIQQADPYIELFNADVLAKTKIDPKELLSVLKLCRLYKDVHNKIYNIKEPAERFSTIRINELSSEYIAMGIKCALDEFNKKYPPEKPN